MDAVDLFRVLADRTRLRVVHLLVHRGPEMCVCDLVSVLDLPQGTISRHLMQLRHLAVVNVRRAGLWIHYSLAEPSSELHRAVIKSLRESTRDDAELMRDLVRFDKLHKSKSLACCAPREGASEAKPAKAGQRPRSRT